VLEQRVKRVPIADLTAAQLTAQEGFVLSRVDGETTVELLCLVTGLGQDLTIATLGALAEKGLVTIGAGGGVTDDAATSTGNAPVIEDGPASVVAEADAGANSGGGNGVAQAEASPSSPPTVEPPRSDENLAAEPSLAALLDRDEQEGIDLPRDFRERVRTFRVQLRELNFFELLDVSSDADAKTIRRAYFKLSKQFHPDRYYTKTLGPYNEMLAEIFRQVQAAYEFLLDDDKRQAYRSTVEQQEREHALSEQLQKDADETLRAAGITGDETGAAANSGAEPSPPRRTRTRSRAVSTLVQRHLRGQFRTGRAGTGRDVASGATDAPGTPAQPIAVVAPEDHPARATRRELDRIRQKRRSKQTFTAVLTQRREKAEDFYRVGVKELEDGNVMAAAASLKLAVSFDPENPLYRAKYQTASASASEISAENAFKRAVFEESVGRHETAAEFFQQAAESSTHPTYLVRAAESMRINGKLIKSREYATKAVQHAPEMLEARLALGRILLAIGQKKSARREADAAKKIAPGSPEVKELLKQIKRT
jgi:curved DNA-binding protein CbpA